MDDLTEILMENYEKASNDKNSSGYSEKDGIAMGALLIEYLKEAYSLSNDDVDEVIANFFAWIYEKHPDIFDFIRELGSI